MEKDVLIEKFFEKKLTPQEKLDFDHLLETDAAFAEKVDFEKKLKTAIILESRSKLKAGLQAREVKKNSRILVWFTAAASFLLLLGLSFLFFKSHPTAEQLFAEFFEPYPNTVMPLVRGNQQNVETRAFLAYEKGDYLLASELFESLQTVSDEEHIPFYLAISKMKLNEGEQAEELFKSIDWSPTYQEKVRWYLALNYIQLNKIEEAKSELEKIISQKTYNHNEARKLHQKLKKSEFLFRFNLKPFR